MQRRVFRRKPNGDVEVVDVPFSASEILARAIEQEAQRLARAREKTVSALQAEGLRRIAEKLPAFDSIEKVELLMQLWPVLDSPGLHHVFRDIPIIYGYMRSQIARAQAPEHTLEQLRAYDAATDPDWP